jgi:hypothetical protein
MRFGEKCPNCGYEERENWRPKPFMGEIDIIEADETSIRLEPGEVKVIGQWVYHRTKTGKWVERMLKTTWESWGCSFRFPKGYYDRTRHGSFYYAMRRGFWHSVAEKKGLKTHRLDEFLKG